MRKSPTIAQRICKKCGTTFTPTGNTQLYCPPCKATEDKARKQRWYTKNNPNAYSVKVIHHCAACGELGVSSLNGIWYCNKHWQKMYARGTLNYVRAPKSTFEVCGEAVTITTSRGGVILVDAEYLPIVSGHSWCVSKNGYAVARINGKNMRLHRYLFNPPDNIVMDHLNGNKLDCRKQNLRLCETISNSRNLKVKKNNTSGYPGIRRVGKRFKVRIMVYRKEISAGTFDTLGEAIDARINAELRHYGTFAPSLGVLKELAAH